MGSKSENKAPDGVVVLNYAQAKVKLPGAEEIPTLVSDAVLAELTKDDPEPYFSIQAIRFPSVGNGLRYGSVGIYKKNFFNSYINKTKNSPIPGSKFGHEYSQRPANDFYMVGGKIVNDESDKEAGTAYFKMYIPPRGYTTDNYGLLRDARAHLVQYSLVAKPEYTVKRNNDGIEEYHITGSLGGERNDAVEDGAMNQIVNSSTMPLDVDAAKALISSGAFDKETKIDGEAIQNGIVYRSALRVMLSRANETERPVLGELISMIDKTKNNGGKSVETKDEALGILANLVTNGRASVTEIAKALGFEGQIRNEADVKNAELVKALNAKLGEKPLEALETILAENAANAVATVKNAIVDLAGPETLDNPDKTKTEKIPNAAHAYAAKVCAWLTGEPLKNAIEALKKDPAMIALNGLRADGESGMNKVLHNASHGNAQNDSGDGIPTIHIGKKE